MRTLTDDRLHKPSVAIVGGGLTGAAIAYHLANSAVPANIAVFEPRPEIGRGLAYGTTDPAHRINVPASKMSLLPSDEKHFINWIAANDATADDADALAPDGHQYIRRALFGRYVSAHLQPHLDAGRIDHIRAAVVDIARASPHRWRITTDDGTSHHADVVVLATTHPPPGIPRELREGVDDDARLITDATLPGAIDAIAPTARVVIVGTGLTMADVVASLDQRGHRGPIYAFSRRGLASRGHASAPHEPFGDFTGSATSARALLRSVRETISRAKRNNIPWQPVIDAVRAQAWTFWPKLSISERKRIVHRLRPFWDVHRFRIAPQLKALLDRRQADGTLTLKAASLVGAKAFPDRLEIKVRPRAESVLETINADHVILTTGPAHDAILATQPHLASLARQGLITADALGLGIACDRQGHARTSAGASHSDLFIAGPLARAEFGELMGLPQVTTYAELIAGEVAAALARFSAPQDDKLVSAQ
ncbi:FAD/NAD(P)-binding protein [Hyphomicrobium sulfonivorans]|uniref:FAD/NAD(P)-binding protein n=1 Tax=Hyphomicrobium sulfonivorans TaxID=121290 RepID=UPI00156D5773|nr:FAD-dependent oxidoreductase [Hyphomicrobium sulfonivorans]MBI1649105.1 FAD/NAD(P)-binding protein [Hyphomicrobium sulfonivorans]NSL70364.1 hydroxyacylglutathione hydrolase [Hyphomicrobium sulfonivorans]